MSTVQSVYSDNIPVGYAGAIVSGVPKTLLSRTVEDAAGIAFGLAVMQGTEDKGIVVSDGSAFLGVTVRTQSINPETPDLFAEDDEARVMTLGVIWVANSGGVTAGEQAEAGVAGILTAAASAPIAGSRWDTSALDGELAQLRLA